MTNDTIHARLVAVESALRDVVAFEDRAALDAWQEAHPGESIYAEMMLRHMAAREVLEGASYETAREIAAQAVAGKLDTMRDEFMETVGATPQVTDWDSGQPVRFNEGGEYHPNGTGVLEKMPPAEDVEPDEAALARAENERVLEAYRNQAEA